VKEEAQGRGQGKAPSPESGYGVGERPRESARASTTPRPFCGARWPEPLASFDRATSLWRTWRPSLLSTMEPSGERFSGTWPRSGSMSSGIVYPRQPSVPRTSVIGSSLLPTPRASLNEMRTTKRTPSQEAGTHGRYLTSELLSLKLLPTPVEQDGKNATAPSQEDRKSPGLPTTLRLLRTPTAAPHNQPGANGGENRKELLSLLIGPSTGPQLPNGNKSSDGLLENPCFREWLLGAPAGWSDPDCPLSATEFKSRSATSPAATSLNASESD
jgi:hypothetical protein